MDWGWVCCFSCFFLLLIDIRIHGLRKGNGGSDSGSLLYSSPLHIPRNKMHVLNTYQ